MPAANRRQGVRFDEAQLAELKRILKDIPKRLRGQPVVAGLKKAANPLLQSARTVGPAMVNSPTIARSFQVVSGKYRKKTRPYVVLKHRNKLFATRRQNEGFSARHETNWNKVGHLSAQGTAKGLRVAKKGQFLVFSQGRVIPVKQIRHPGTTGAPVFDEALRRAARPATSEFMKFAKNKLKKIQAKLK